MINTSALTKILLGVLAFAIFGGWSVHRQNPSGLPSLDPCAAAHGFVAVYRVVVGVAAAFAITVAIAASIFGQLRLFANARDGLRRVSLTAVALAAVLGMAMLAATPIAQLLPLVPRPDCKAPVGAASGLGALGSIKFFELSTQDA